MPEDTHSSHTVLKPLRLPRRRQEVEDGSVKVIDDAVMAYDADGEPLGYFAVEGEHREIRPVLQPGQTVKIEDPALARRLVKDGVLAEPGAKDVVARIHAAYTEDVYDAESALSED